MAQPIDTIAKAVRRGMLVRAECQCGNVSHYLASDLMMVFGGGRDPLDLPFRCKRCKPNVRVTLVDVDWDRPPKVPILQPFIEGGKVKAWMQTRLKR